MHSALPPFCSAGRCDTYSGEVNDTDCRSDKFQLKASDPEKKKQYNLILNNKEQPKTS